MITYRLIARKGSMDFGRHDVQVERDSLHIAWHHFNSRAAALAWCLRNNDARQRQHIAQAEIREWDGRRWALVADPASETVGA